MQLKKLILNTKSAWVDYPGLEERNYKDYEKNV